MKKVSYIPAVLAGLFYLFISWAGYMAAKEAGSQGRSIPVGFLNLESSLVVLLLAILSLLALVGGVAGLISKSWAKNLSLT